ncbi:hypothetical protein ZIOFF_051150 [Zingiber officinale]|uniref:Uncharacterized protein n=1 Tax=Zingiber officinale TaxID=94328 RepID=A0A8J5FLJ9_ZINOF|nr:hypothetical protein ZIOFF_051150 [Zingiber officinale]
MTRRGQWLNRTRRLEEEKAAWTAVDQGQGLGTVRLGAFGVGIGNFQEIGPMDTNLKPHNSTWLQKADLLFVARPQGSRSAVACGQAKLRRSAPVVPPLGSAEGWGLFDVSAEPPMVDLQPGGRPARRGPRKQDPPQPPLKRMGHFVEEESLLEKSDWEAAANLTALLKKLYHGNVAMQRRTKPSSSWQSYCGRFTVTTALSVLHAIRARQLKLKLEARVPYLLETDKATVEMECMEEGYLAKIIHGDGSKEIKVGEEEGDIEKFKDDKVSESAGPTEVQPPSEPAQSKKDICCAFLYSTAEFSHDIVFGKEARGRVRGMGFGVTPSKVGASVQQNRTIASGDICSGIGNEIGSNRDINIGAKKSGDFGHIFQSNLRNVSRGYICVNTKCKLLHWSTDELVVAEGRIASTDPNTKVHHVILGGSCWKV